MRIKGRLFRLKRDESGGDKAFSFEDAASGGDDIQIHLDIFGDIGFPEDIEPGDHKDGFLEIRFLSERPDLEIWKDSREIAFYKGKPIADMTRNEILEALQTMTNIYLETLNRHQRDLDILVKGESDDKQ